GPGAPGRARLPPCQAAAAAGGPPPPSGPGGGRVPLRRDPRSLLADLARGRWRQDRGGAAPALPRTVGHPETHAPQAALRAAQARSELPAGDGLGDGELAPPMIKR